MEKTILSVPDISCGHCALLIVKALRPIEGVRDVKVSIPSKRIEVEYDEGLVTVERMAEALAEQDYPVASAEEVPLPSAG